ncbi:MAG TPA: hypothetical protein VM677_32900 [Actinokineospora sp.]|jgi:hypothetical protein|nr:hypothetical protein [Actinokineospora sp.]
MGDGFAVDPDRLSDHIGGLAGPADRATMAGGAIAEIGSANSIGPIDAAYGLTCQHFGMALGLVQAPVADNLRELSASLAAMTDQLTLTVEAYAEVEQANTLLLEHAGEELNRMRPRPVRRRPR